MVFKWLMGLVVVFAFTGAASAEEVAPETQWWRPQPGVPWQIQLDGRLDLRPRVKVFDLDLFDAPVSVIRSLKARGVRIICYFSAGSYESWRSDARSFPASVKGRAMSGWPGERWLDIRQVQALLPIIERRLDFAKSKGCDAVDPDNVDAYANRTGFPLSYTDQIAYNRAIADAAHQRGLGVGLKNDIEQIPDLVGDFDFAVNEQCFQYNECSELTPFVSAGKPVFGIEYNVATRRFCPRARALGFSVILKRRSLGAWRAGC